MEFTELTIKGQEDILMLEILRALKRLGGSANKTEIKNSILENGEVIPESFFTEVRKGKTGRYLPSNYRLNFSISNLVFSGYLLRSSNRTIELTPKGRDINLSNFNAE